MTGKACRNSIPICVFSACRSSEIDNAAFERLLRRLVRHGNLLVRSDLRRQGNQRPVRVHDQGLCVFFEIQTVVDLPLTRIGTLSRTRMLLRRPTSAAQVVHFPSEVHGMISYASFPERRPQWDYWYSKSFLVNTCGRTCKDSSGPYY